MRPHAYDDPPNLDFQSVMDWAELQHCILGNITQGLSNNAITTALKRFTGLQISTRSLTYALPIVSSYNAATNTYRDTVEDMAECQTVIRDGLSNVTRIHILIDDAQDVFESLKRLRTLTNNTSVPDLWLDLRQIETSNLRAHLGTWNICDKVFGGYEKGDPMLQTITWLLNQSDCVSSKENPGMSLSQRQDLAKTLRDLSRHTPKQSISLYPLPVGALNRHERADVSQFLAHYIVGNAASHHSFMVWDMRTATLNETSHHAANTDLATLKRNTEAEAIWLVRDIPGQFRLPVISFENCPERLPSRFPALDLAPYPLPSN